MMDRLIYNIYHYTIRRIDRVQLKTDATLQNTEANDMYNPFSSIFLLIHNTPLNPMRHRQSVQR